MGIFSRPDSPYWWLYLETAPKGRQKVRTSVPVGKTVAQRRDSRRLAEDLYYQRMNELAEIATSIARANGTRTATTFKPLRRSPEGWCYIYIIQQGELAKIGRTVDLDKRLKALQIGNGRGFQVRAAIPAHAAIEGAIHSRFAHLKEQGEWFRLAPDLERFIERLQQGANPIALLWDDRE